jgi:hypothetical protein
MRKIGKLRAALNAVDRQRSAVKHGLAELDLGVRRAFAAFTFARNGDASQGSIRYKAISAIKRFIATSRVSQ